MDTQTPRRELHAAVRELDARYGDDTGLPDAEHNHGDRMEHIGTCPACAHNARALSRILRRNHDARMAAIKARKAGR